MNFYRALNNQIFKKGKYCIVPIRSDDRYDIMQWRNDQIYHLRQKELLSKESQDKYFLNVVKNLFDLSNPDQLLFSFLKEKKCVGYGGLVHINWEDEHAEVSFVMNTFLENDYFYKYWSEYLYLIEKVAFEDLKLNKIFVYAYDLRPKLYEVLTDYSYTKEAVLKRHHRFNNAYVDVLIFSKFNL
tara:strand:+ start:177 stop:731 length:555 start_codon:yes stop_codon:yes gene_type:complete